MPIKLGIIGGGVMGEALLSRLLAQQLYQPDEVLVSELLEQRRDGLAQEYGIRVTVNNQAAAAASEVLLLAIKPQVFEVVAAELVMGRGDNGHSLGTLPMVISILAGVPLERLENAFPSQSVIRAMPNTPATVGAGITALAAGKWVSSDQMERAKTIFRAVGEVVEIPEHLMDAVTGLSGSGPAYVAILMEALADGGVAAGLPRAIALQLAQSTVLGTAQLLQETQMHPAQLKDQVSSPGGTTIAAIAKLEKAGFRSALIEAVLGSYQRSRELGS